MKFIIKAFNLTVNISLYRVIIVQIFTLLIVRLGKWTRRQYDCMIIISRPHIAVSDTQYLS